MYQSQNKQHGAFQNNANFSRGRGGSAQPGNGNSHLGGHPQQVSSFNGGINNQAKPHVPAKTPLTKRLTTDTSLGYVPNTRNPNAHMTPMQAYHAQNAASRPTTHKPAAAAQQQQQQQQQPIENTFDQNQPFSQNQPFNQNQPFSQNSQPFNQNQNQNQSSQPFNQNQSSQPFNQNQNSQPFNQNQNSQPQQKPTAQQFNRNKGFAPTASQQQPAQGRTPARPMLQQAPQIQPQRQVQQQQMQKQQPEQKRFVPQPQPQRFAPAPRQQSNNNPLSLSTGQIGSVKAPSAISMDVSAANAAVAAANAAVEAANDASEVDLGVTMEELLQRNNEMTEQFNAMSATLRTFITRFEALEIKYPEDLKVLKIESGGIREDVNTAVESVVKQVQKFEAVLAANTEKVETAIRHIDDTTCSILVNYTEAVYFYAEAEEATPCGQLSAGIIRLTYPQKEVHLADNATEWRMRFSSVEPEHGHILTGWVPVKIESMTGVKTFFADACDIPTTQFLDLPRAMPCEIEQQQQQQEPEQQPEPQQPALALPTLDTHPELQPAVAAASTPAPASTA